MAKKLVQYSVVDAFTDTAFKGNPAAVCLLEEQRDDEWLQAVASEFNISETCYLTKLTDESQNPRFHLRWFTPVAEVALCGHATLAASHTVFSRGLVQSNIIEFVTLWNSDCQKVPDPDVKATKDSNLQNDETQECYFIELDFPTDSSIDFNSDQVSSIPKALSISSTSIIDVKITTTLEDIFVVLPSAKSVTELQPQFEEMLKFPGRGLIVSGHAPSESGFDFYSRFFCPKLGVNEASSRSGILNIHLDEQKQRVLLRGKLLL